MAPASGRRMVLKYVVHSTCQPAAAAAMAKPQDVVPSVVMARDVMSREKPLVRRNGDDRAPGRPRYSTKLRNVTRSSRVCSITSSAVTRSNVPSTTGDSQRVQLGRLCARARVLLTAPFRSYRCHSPARTSSAKRSRVPPCATAGIAGCARRGEFDPAKSRADDPAATPVPPVALVERDVGL